MNPCKVTVYARKKKKKKKKAENVDVTKRGIQTLTLFKQFYPTAGIPILNKQRDIKIRKETSMKKKELTK